MEISELRINNYKLSKPNKFVGTVYAFINKVNKKIYIGKTILTPSERWSEHKYMAFKKKQKNRFYIALRKYGWNGFDKIVIYQTQEFSNPKDPDNIIIEKERFYINLFRSDSIDFGYNSTKGGDGIVGYRHTKETREKMSLDRSGKNHWNYGNRNKTGRPVIQVDLDFNFIREYPSLKEVARYYGVKQVTSEKIGDNKTYRNTILIDKSNYSIEYLKEHYSDCKRASNDKFVYRFDFNGNKIGEFISTSEAGRQLNCDPSGISCAAKGKTFTCLNSIWIYKEDFSNEVLNQKLIDFKNSKSYKKYLKLGKSSTRNPNNYHPRKSVNKKLK